MGEGKEGLDVSGMSEKEKIKLGKEKMTPGEQEMNATREKLIDQNYEKRFEEHLDQLELWSRENESEDQRKFFAEKFRVLNLVKEAAINLDETLIDRVDTGDGSIYWDWVDSIPVYFNERFLLGYFARTYSHNEMGIRWTPEGIQLVRLEPMEPGTNIDIY